MGTYDELDAPAGPGPLGQVLTDALEFVLRSLPLLVVAGALGAATGAWQSYTSPPVFRASTKLFVDDPITASPLTAPADLADMRKATLSRRLEVLRSIPVADEVKRLLEPAASGELHVRRGSQLTAGPHSPTELELRLRDPGYVNHLLALRNTVDVGGDADNSVITISATGGEPAALAQRVNAYARAYQRLSLERRNAQANRVLAKLEQAAAPARRNLERAESLQRGAGSPEAMAALRALLRDQRQLLARLDQLSTESAACIRAAYGEPDVPLGPDPATSPSPASGEPSGDASVQDSATLLRQLEVLEAELELPATDAGAFARAAAKLVVASDRLLAAAVSRRELLALRISLTPPDVVQVDPATVPSVPIGPSPAEHIARYGGMGFGAMFLLLLFLEQSATTLHGRKAIARAARQPVLGVVPTDELARRSRTVIPMHEASANAVSEAVRDVRASLKYAHGLSSRRLLVTSALAAEGKTTLAANLAVAFAHLGERVLLVDGDLRCPRLHEAFAQVNDAGLSQLFSAPDVTRLARETAVPGLALVTAGPLLASPSEFLCQPQFREKLAALAAPYDRVIVDSSPVNQVSDAGILAYHVDGVVLVARDRHCTDTALELAVERLGAGPAKLLGLVINDLAPTLLNRRYAYYSREP